MVALQTVVLDQQLQVVGDAVTSIKSSIFTRLVRDLQTLIDVLFIEANASGELCQSLVCIIACFMNDVDVEVFCLLIE